MPIDDQVEVSGEGSDKEHEWEASDGKKNKQYKKAIKGKIKRKSKTYKWKRFTK